jgi:hypothetical protein
MDELTAAPLSASSLLTDLRDLARDEGPDSLRKLRLGTDRLIIAAMGRVDSSSGAKIAAAETARACRSLAMDLQQSEQLHNAAASDALTEARAAAIEAIDHLEAELASCPPPAQSDHPRRRTAVRSSSVVMKKRRPMFAGHDSAKAAKAEA